MSVENKTNLSNSEMNNDINQCLTNLKILAKIKKNNKLVFFDDKFIIDEWNYTQPLRRWWTEESRSATITHLEAFIQKCFSIIDTIYQNECALNDETTISNSYYIPETAFKEKNSNILLQFITELNNAIDGLLNLKQTYKTDITIVSSLEMLIEKLNVRAKKISGILAVAATRS
tara:strand:- start:1976 stop:2497 length:522 start_codon:yes stop_codon:yes gene_type:complete